jgi:hypothetical protein
VNYACQTTIWTIVRARRLQTVVAGSANVPVQGAAASLRRASRARDRKATPAAVFAETSRRRRRGRNPYQTRPCPRGGPGVAGRAGLRRPRHGQEAREGMSYPRPRRPGGGNRADPPKGGWRRSGVHRTSKQTESDRCRTQVENERLG